MDFFVALSLLIHGARIKRADDNVVYFSNNRGLTIEGFNLSDGAEVPVILTPEEINAGNWEVVE